MKKVLQYFPIVVFFGLLVGGMALGYFMPDKVVSAVEGRALTQLPTEVTAELPAQLTDYVVEQFPGRNTLMKSYTALELLQQKWKVRDTYVAENDWLLSPVYHTDPQRQQAIVTAMEQWAQTATAQFFYSCVPQKTDALWELGVPPYDPAIGRDNREQLADIMAKTQHLHFVDVCQYFDQNFTLEQREDLYYQTDFHWNHRGAFAAANFIGETMAQAGVMTVEQVLQEEDFLWQDYSATHQYQGDLNRRFSNLFSMKEQLPYYQGKQENLTYYKSVDQSVAVEKQEIFPVDFGSQTTLDYNLLSTDNLGYYQVVNPHSPVEKNLLIVKDSYENPMTEYFVQTFQTVHVIDPRAYEEPYSFQELLDVADIDVVLFVYHQNNASQELLDFLTKKEKI